MGRSRGGLSTKIHLSVDAEGKPLRFLLTGGHRHDAPQAPALLEGMQAEWVLADRAYDSQKIIDLIQKMGATPVIPSQSTRKRPREYDPERYKARNVIERSINKLKACRRIATRFDRKAAHYLAFLHLAAAVIWPT